MAKIAVIGAGFVGQATGKALGKHNNDITFVDVDRKKVSLLEEQGFVARLSGQYTKIDGDVTMFCVSTRAGNGSLQLSHLKQAAEEFAERLKNHKAYHLVVIRSTVPPTTTRSLVLPLIERISGKKAGKDFGLCMQPEYLRKKTAAQDAARPWFVLIGAYDTKSGDALEKIYRKFDAPIQRLSLEEAEFQKYVHNAYNAVKVSFFSEMRRIAKAERWRANNIFYATAESSEAVWNPLYGMREPGQSDSSNLRGDALTLVKWGEAKSYSLNSVRAVLSEPTASMPEAPEVQ